MGRKGWLGKLERDELARLAAAAGLSFTVGASDEELRAALRASERTEGIGGGVEAWGVDSVKAYLKALGASSTGSKLDLVTRLLNCRHQTGAVKRARGASSAKGAPQTVASLNSTVKEGGIQKRARTVPAKQSATQTVARLRSIMKEQKGSKEHAIRVLSAATETIVDLSTCLEVMRALVENIDSVAFWGHADEYVPDLGGELEGVFEDAKPGPITDELRRLTENFSASLANNALDTSSIDIAVALLPPPTKPAYDLGF